MATQSIIDYEQLQQDAMRSLVKAVLDRVALEQKLPGDHHFYISFLTQTPGVILSKRLREKYPQEMTIVLQHRFWDLIVTDARFEVKLTFDGIPERLVVPYISIKAFIDPSVGFGMQFEGVPGDDDDGSVRQDLAPPESLTLDAAYDGIGEARLESPRATLIPKVRTVRRPKTSKDGLPALPSSKTLDREPAAADADDTNKSRAAAAETDAPHPSDAVASADSEAADTSSSGAQIFSLDQFRKK